MLTMASPGYGQSPGEPPSPENPSSLPADSISSGSSFEDATCPIDESLRDYPFLFNRRYHKYREGSYPFPNDDQEQERLDIQFNLIKQAQGSRLFFAPVQNARNVLDVGTGTGIWCIALADSELFPEAQITGIDLSPTQNEDLVPVNVSFELQDCTDTDWARPLGSLDFIYTQSLFGSLRSYSEYLITARKYLVPGTGWIECCELDIKPRCDDSSMPGADSESELDEDEMTYRRCTNQGGSTTRSGDNNQSQQRDYAFKRWTDWLHYACEKQGRPIRIAKKVKKWMIAAGYVDVQVVTTKIPIGSWPKDKRLKAIGRNWAKLLSDTLPAASYKPFNDSLDWSRDEIEVFLAEVRQSLKERSIHAYMKNYTVFGRRPSADEERAMGRMAPPPLPMNNIGQQPTQQPAVT